MKELKSLYDKGMGTRNMSPLLKTTGWFVWSNESTENANRTDFRKSFYFGGNGRMYINAANKSKNARAFAVRKHDYPGHILSGEDSARPDHSNKLPKTGIRLALFPSLLRDYRSETEIISGLTAFLEQYKEFELVYSYYEMETERENEYWVGDKTLTKENIQNLWVKHSPFSSKVPNEKLIYKLGQQINMDVIIMYNIPTVTSSGYCPDTIEAYIFDIKRMRMISGRTISVCYQESQYTTKLMKQTFAKLK